MTETWDFDEGDLSIYTMVEGSPVMLFQPHEMCDGDQIPWDEMVAKTRIAAVAPELLKMLDNMTSALAAAMDDVTRPILAPKIEVTQRAAYALIAKATHP